MILMLGQTRVAFAMARDGLLPPALAKVHPTFRTPWVITAITGVAVAIIGGLVDLETLVHLVSIGTLFAFVLVSLGVVVLRRTRPDLPRLPDAGRLVVAILGAALPLPDAQPHRRHLGAVRVWMAIGIVVYAFYGRTHSRLARASEVKTSRLLDARPSRRRSVAVPDGQLSITRGGHW